MDVDPSRGEKTSITGRSLQGYSLADGATVEIFTLRVLTKLSDGIF